MTMPEEINRMVTDSISDYFFVTEQSGADNLLREGKPSEKVHLVGHVMIDNLLRQVERLEQGFEVDPKVQELKKQFREYGFMTLHRPSNVDHRENLKGILEALDEISSALPLIFPVHPRTRKMLDKHKLSLPRNIIPLEPLGFLDALYLWKDAKVVLTDSGGLQEETTALGVPCITIRENTERPITVELGTNILAGCKKEGIIEAYQKQMAGEKTGRVPPLWDGRASERIWQVIT